MSKTIAQREREAKALDMISFIQKRKSVSRRDQMDNATHNMTAIEKTYFSNYFIGALVAVVSNEHFNTALKIATGMVKYRGVSNGQSSHD